MVSTQLEQRIAAAVAVAWEAAEHADQNGYNVARIRDGLVEYTDPRINIVTAVTKAFWTYPGSDRDLTNQADIAAFGAAIVVALEVDEAGIPQVPTDFHVGWRREWVAP